MYKDLLEQAHALARFDTKGKPRQASLRRAVSAAYYSLFHFLVDQACRGIIGTQHVQQGYRHSLARAFVHTEMKKACRSFAGGQLPATVIKPLPKTAAGLFLVSTPIRDIAGTFVSLQEIRHLADYDLSERFKRSEVLTLLDRVETHIEDFTHLPVSDDRQFFLVCLLSWKELTNR